MLFTFALVSSLFLLWGFCNGMIDVMDKHFQEELDLTLAQSAWVQFAHYLGYFLMAMPAGWLATRLGYKGGIIAGLLMVAVGGFWFIPADEYRRVLGVSAGRVRDRRRPDVSGNGGQSVHDRAGFAALRGDAHQPGPILQRRRLDSRARSPAACSSTARMRPGISTGAETLWIPYAGVAVVVLVLAVVFFFAPVPDIKTEDDYDIGKKGERRASLRAGRAASGSRAGLFLAVVQHHRAGRRHRHDRVADPQAVRCWDRNWWTSRPRFRSRPACPSPPTTRC